MKALVLVLAGALSLPVQAKPDWESFLAAAIGAIIIANMAEDRAEDRAAVQPPPPPKKPARTVYLEHCVSYGFSMAFCVQNWDGPAPTIKPAANNPTK